MLKFLLCNKAPLVKTLLLVESFKVERELFEIPKKRLGYSNFSKEEWECMRSLGNDIGIVVKKSR